jgi:hypothetical protein
MTKLFPPKKTLSSIQQVKWHMQNIPWTIVNFEVLVGLKKFIFGSGIEMDVHKFFIRGYDRYFIQTLVSCSWVFFYWNLIQCEQFHVWGVYPLGVVWDSHLLCFEISKHTKETSWFFRVFKLCFELGFP